MAVSWAVIVLLLPAIVSSLARLLAGSRGAAANVTDCRATRSRRTPRYSGQMACTSLSLSFMCVCVGLYWLLPRLGMAQRLTAAAAAA